MRVRAAFRHNLRGLRTQLSPRSASQRWKISCAGPRSASSTNASVTAIGDDQIPRVREGSWNRILCIYGRPPNEADQIKAAEGMAAFWRYAEDLVRARTKEPRDDFTSAIAWATDDDGVRLTEQQAATVVSQSSVRWSRNDDRHPRKRLPPSAC